MRVTAECSKTEQRGYRWSSDPLGVDEPLEPLRAVSYRLLGHFVPSSSIVVRFGPSRHSGGSLIKCHCSSEPPPRSAYSPTTTSETLSPPLLPPTRPTTCHSHFRTLLQDHDYASTQPTDCIGATLQFPTRVLVSENLKPIMHRQPEVLSPPVTGPENRLLQQDNGFPARNLWLGRL
jgi:hypothetical protein